MSLRKEIIKEIEVLEKEMQELESKRARSIAALMEAVISKRDPDPAEMQYFRQYNTEIEETREKLIRLNKHLKKMVD
ncbi:MAG: hypothetical protein J1G38_01530 [Clostridiales bacterium]|nr:hypothetical protein [Clostridiales bacterium]